MLLCHWYVRLPDDKNPIFGWLEVLVREIGVAKNYGRLNPSDASTFSTNRGHARYDVLHMPRRPALSHDVLHAALHGLELRKTTLDAQIARVQSMLGIGPKRLGRPPQQELVADGAGDTSTPVNRRRFTAAARKRMAEAQRRRWAAIKKGKARA